MIPSGFPLTSVLLIVRGLPPQTLAAASPEAARALALRTAFRLRASGVPGPFQIQNSLKKGDSL